MTAPSSPASGPGSRGLVAGLLLVAVAVAVVPVFIARTRRVQEMRADLTEVLGECRTRYEAARTAADTAAADAWQPSLHGERRPGDPACGPYRRRNMLKPVSR
jgi:hypothetical protein